MTCALIVGVSLIAVGGGTAPSVVAASLGVVAGLAVYAAVEDARSWRIANGLVLLGLLVVVAGSLAMVIVDGVPGRDLGTGVAVGSLLSGAPVAFVLWLVHPGSLGGGDWKLLSVLGATLGLWAPAVAPLIVIGGSPVLVVQQIARGGRGAVPFGPAFAVGYLVAIAVGLSFPILTGGIT